MTVEFILERSTTAILSERNGRKKKRKRKGSEPLGKEIKKKKRKNEDGERGREAYKGSTKVERAKGNR